MQRSSSLVSMSNGSKQDELPKWDPLSESSKKEVVSLVHLVPFVIIFCTILLWFFSYPESSTAEHSRTQQTGDGKEFDIGSVQELK